MSGISSGHSLIPPTDGDKKDECAPAVQLPTFPLSDRIMGNGGHFHKRRERETKIWFITSYFFLVVLEFPFLDVFLTCVNL